jgi:hypothetical protein
MEAKVFIAGSRRLTRLNEEIRGRLNNVIRNGCAVYVGDANGADKAVQTYLASKSYRNVLVFCVARHCRNNLGQWPTREIEPPPRASGFELFSAKDRVMAREAECGLMLWDGKSRGTLANIMDLVSRGKPAVVYFSPSKSFVTVRSADQAWKMANNAGHESLGNAPVSRLAARAPHPIRVFSKEEGKPQR